MSHSDRRINLREREKKVYQSQIILNKGKILHIFSVSHTDISLLKNKQNQTHYKNRWKHISKSIQSFKHETEYLYKLDVFVNDSIGFIIT